MSLNKCHRNSIADLGIFYYLHSVSFLGLLKKILIERNESVVILLLINQLLYRIKVLNSLVLTITYLQHRLDWSVLCQQKFDTANN